MPLDQSYINRKVSLVSEVYHHDLRFHVHEIELKITPCAGGANSGRRGKIKGYSEKSKRGFRFALRNTAHYWTHEGMLSYPSDFPTNGRIVKLHRKRFIEALQRKYPGIYWVWRLGFQQERGRKGLGYAPHFHFLFNCFVCKDWLASTWARIVDSADVNHKKVGTHVGKIRHIKGMVNYMVNYMTEDKETDVPEGFEDVGRFWGIKRGIVEKEEFKKVGTFRDTTRALRLFKRWMKAEYRSWQEGRIKKGLPYRKWRPSYSGKGFLVIGGKRIVDALMKLRV